MVSAKTLIKLTRKWRKWAAISRKRITMPTTFGKVDADDCSTLSSVEKGYFVFYTIDKRRFMLPLEYLNNIIVRELFKQAEEEFGLPSNGPLTLPCDAGFMNYIIDLMQRKVTKDVEKALLTSMASHYCSSSLHLNQAVTCKQLLVCSF